MPKGARYLVSSGLYWKRESFMVNENYADVKARGGIDAIADYARQRFMVAQREGFDHFAFYGEVIRFIPENPNYTGALARRQGKWAPDLVPVRRAKTVHQRRHDDDQDDQDDRRVRAGWPHLARH